MPADIIFLNDKEREALFDQAQGMAWKPLGEYRQGDRFPMTIDATILMGLIHQVNVLKQGLRDVREEAVKRIDETLNGAMI